MFQMSIRASSATRLLVAVGVAWLGLALSAQAAHATYSRVQVVKINQGGDPNDVFTFDTSLKPAASPASFNLKGGQSSSIYGVECNVGSSCTSQWGNSVQTITERAAAGYTLTAIACYHTQGTNGWPSEPNTSSALDTDTTSDLAARKINFKLNWWEWVKCYVTNTRDTGTIKVTKKLVPATDSGKFNLLIDGQAKATNVGDGGTTGTQTVLPGTHTVGEAAGTATDLSNYDSTHLVRRQGPRGQAGRHRRQRRGGQGRPVGVRDHQHAQEHAHAARRRRSRRPRTPTVTPPRRVQAVSPQVRVSPARVRPGSAKLSGPSGCPTTSAVAASVSGRRIVKVTFYVDGKKVKTLTKANRNGRWVLPMNVKRFAFGTHRVRVTVQFAKSSQTKAKTLRLSFNRCHPAVVKPQFTG